MYFWDVAGKKQRNADCLPSCSWKDSSYFPSSVSLIITYTSVHLSWSLECRLRENLLTAQTKGALGVYYEST